MPQNPRESTKSASLLNRRLQYCIDVVTGLDAGFMAGTVPLEGRLPVEVKKGSRVERLLMWRTIWRAGRIGWIHCAYEFA